MAETQNGSLEQALQKILYSMYYAVQSMQISHLLLRAGAQSAQWGTFPAATENPRPRLPCGRSVLQPTICSNNMHERSSNVMNTTIH